MRYRHHATVNSASAGTGTLDPGGNWVPDASPDGPWYDGPVDIQDEGEGRPKELTGEASAEASAIVWFPPHVDVSTLDPEDTMTLNWHPHLPAGQGVTATAEVVRVVRLDGKVFVRYA